MSRTFRRNEENWKKDHKDKSFKKNPKIKEKIFKKQSKGLYSDDEDIVN